MHGWVQGPHKDLPVPTVRPEQHTGNILRNLVHSGKVQTACADDLLTRAKHMQTTLQPSNVDAHYAHPTPWS